MNKQTLIIDGHNFYFRTLFTLQQPKTHRLLDEQEEVDIFDEKLITDLYYTINKYKSFINDIVFVVDSKSWRKSLLLSDEYKGTRTTEEKINFKNFYSSVEVFNELLKKNGIKVSKVDSCEGDDLVFGWSTYLNSINKPFIIQSTDKDLTQLLDTDVMSSQYNPIQNVLYMSKKNYDILESRKSKMSEFSVDDLFTSEVVTKTEFEKFISSSQCSIHVVDPEEIRFMKVISGDSSDNIVSVYRKTSPSGRLMGIGEKTCVKILDRYKSVIGDPSINYTYYIREYSDTNKLLDIIYEVCKINDTGFTRRMLQENINTNGKLVVLSRATIPDYIQEAINTNIEELKDTTLTFTMRENTRDYWYRQSRFKDKVSSDGSIIKQRGNSLKFAGDDADDLSFLSD